MPYRLRAVARTHAGLVRTNNEDSYFLGEHILLVADGMGGHAAGEVASKITAEQFASLQEVDLGQDIAQPLIDAIDNATEEIASRVERDPELAGMGTTVTAIIFGKRRIVIANIGDSRAYVFHPGTTPLTQLTADDSFVQMMVDHGDITPEQAQNHPYRNVVLKSVDGKPVQPRLTTRDRIPGDRYLLCSDGLTDYVDLADIEVTIEISDIEQCADRLIELALEAGAPDNVTVVLADLIPHADGAADVITTDFTASATEDDYPATRPIQLPTDI